MVSFATDTLTRSDRLDIASLPLQPAVTFTLPPDPIAIFLGSSQTIASAPRLHRPLKQLAKRSTVMLPRPRPKVKQPPTPTDQVRTSSLR